MYFAKYKCLVPFFKLKALLNPSWLCLFRKDVSPSRRKVLGVDWGSDFFPRQQVHPQTWSSSQACPQAQLTPKIDNSSVLPAFLNFFWFSNISIFVFLVFLCDFWLYLGNKKSYRRSAGIKTTRFLRASQISAWVKRLEHPKAAN